jgi:hypothetical protein
VLNVSMTLDARCPYAGKTRIPIYPSGLSNAVSLNSNVEAGFVFDVHTRTSVDTDNSTFRKL